MMSMAFMDMYFVQIIFSISSRKPFRARAHYTYKMSPCAGEGLKCSFRIIVVKKVKLVSKLIPDTVSSASAWLRPYSVVTTQIYRPSSVLSTRRSTSRSACARAWSGSARPSALIQWMSAPSRPLPLTTHRNMTSPPTAVLYRSGSMCTRSRPWPSPDNVTTWC